MFPFEREKGKRERDFFGNIPPKTYIQLSIFFRPPPPPDYWKPQNSEKTGKKNFFFWLGHGLFDFVGGVILQSSL